MTAWLSIVGVGDDGWEGIPSAHQHIIEAADIVVGGGRHLSFLPEGLNKETIAWASPLVDTVEKIKEHKGKQVVVLASGDPLDFGVATTLLRYVPLNETVIYPSSSSLTLACARLGWSRQEVDCLSLHGRPLEVLNSYLYPDAKLLVLSQNGETPTSVAKLLVDKGYSASQIKVFAHLNGEQEGTITGLASEWPSDSCPDLNLIALDCKANESTQLFGRSPGLPDSAFVSDGQLTKRAIRASTLSHLRPTPGQLLWDVGAGSGSIAIEWMRHHPRCRAIAIEQNEKRLGYLASNTVALGTPGLKIVKGSAPVALEGLDKPDAIFVGGGVRNSELMNICYSALKPGGRLVANAVTLEAEAVLLSYFAEKGGSLERIAVSAADAVGGLHGWRPAMPVTQYSLIKE